MILIVFYEIDRDVFIHFYKIQRFFAFYILIFYISFYINILKYGVAPMLKIKDDSLFS